MGRTAGKRAHIVFGTKEKEQNKSPVMLPPCVGGVLGEWCPDEGALAFEKDRVALNKLVLEAHGHLGVQEEEGWNGGYVGKGNGSGRYIIRMAAG